MIPPDAVKSHFDKGLFIPADSDWKEEEKDQTEFVSAYPAIRIREICFDDRIDLFHKHLHFFYHLYPSQVFIR